MFVSEEKSEENNKIYQIQQTYKIQKLIIYVEYLL